MSDTTKVPDLRCGDFDLIDRIGEGATAAVWRARHRDTQVPAAVKIFDAGVDTTLLEREVQVLAKFNHPNIISLYDFGYTESLPGADPNSRWVGAPFLAMEHADGGRIHEHEGIQWQLGAWNGFHRVLMELLDALAYSHAKGVVHRDIKPGNLLVSTRETPDAATGTADKPRILLTDFGLANALRPMDTRETQHRESDSAGTPLYMAPEQFREQWRNFGPWTDLYALGCVAYEMLTGEVPFQASSWLRLAHQHMEEPVPPLEPAIVCPNGVEVWIERMLRKDPVRRFRRASDAATVLSQIASADSWTSSDLSGSDEHGETIISKLPASPHHRADRSDSGPLSQPGKRIAGSTQTQLGLEDSITEIEDFSPPPDLPHTWEFHLPDRASAQLINTSLELFGRQEISVVGRQSLRDDLWDEFATVTHTDSTRCFLLEGTPGLGKSRLARWLAERTHELGVGTRLCARHVPGHGIELPVRRMLEDYLSTWNLSRKRTHRRVRRFLDGVRSDMDDETTTRSLSADAAAVTEFLRPYTTADIVDDELERTLDSREEKFDHLSRLLADIGLTRTPIVWFDAVQCGDFALEFTEYLLDRRPDIGVLVILTVDDIETTLRADFELDRLRDREASTVREIGSMPDDELEELLQRTIRLAPELRAEILDAADGNPLYVRGLLQQWVSRGHLTKRVDTFELADGADAQFPGDIRELTANRVEWVSEHGVEIESYIADRALELAAAFGGIVLDDEWERALEIFDYDIPLSFVSNLFNCGIARPREGGWQFEHQLFRLVLEQRAKGKHRFDESHRICAKALKAAEDDPRPETLERRAQHSEAIELLDKAQSLREQSDALTDFG